MLVREQCATTQPIKAAIVVEARIKIHHTLDGDNMKSPQALFIVKYGNEVQTIMNNDGGYFNSQWWYLWSSMMVV